MDFPSSYKISLLIIGRPTVVLRAMARPNKEDQDEYFRQNGLDPWGYNQPHVLERLHKSLAIIQQALPADFSGVFVEIGAFNGQFTRMLTAAFPAAAVIACDIVKSPWEEAGPFPDSVAFQWCEMADFRMPTQHSKRQTIVLMLECFYYVPAEDRSAALGKMLDQISNLQLLFVSGPLDSGKLYFDESTLRSTFEANGLRFCGANVITPNASFTRKFSWAGDWAIPFLVNRRFCGWLLRRRIARMKKAEARTWQLMDERKSYRRKYAHQVMFQFSV